MRANALIHVAERQVECREVALAAPDKGEVLIKSRFSAISAGTEAMIFSGAFPENTALDACIKSLPGDFAYPFSYGYALVGEVSATGPGMDQGLIGKTLFAFHPHQDWAVVPLAACLRIPDGVPPEAALFLPQLETALNLVMDGAPLIGERVLVFGQGVVGLLTGALLAKFPLARLVAAEPLAWRRDLAKHWGIAETVNPADVGQWQALLDGLDGADLVFELSGDMAALNRAIEVSGFEARIVVGSWYGARSQPLDLGGRFHRNRLRFISSQVSTLDPVLTGRWDKRRRFDLAWRMAQQLEPQRLISRSFSLAQCQLAFETVCSRRDGVMQVIFEYPPTGRNHPCTG
jgi:2-desacetyl-2-hydroxyethyl bacteriochlorophyllide A dehydrogenase